MLVLTVFSFEIGKEHKRVVSKCLCKGEYLQTHDNGSGTKFVGGCKEGWYQAGGGLAARSGTEFT